MFLIIAEKYVEQCEEPSKALLKSAENALALTKLGSAEEETDGLELTDEAQTVMIERKHWRFFLMNKGPFLIKGINL